VRSHKFKILETPNQVIRRGLFPLGHVDFCSVARIFLFALGPKAFGDFDRLNVEIIPPLGLWSEPESNSLTKMGAENAFGFERRDIESGRDPRERTGVEFIDEILSQSHTSRNAIKRRGAAAHGAWLLGHHGGRLSTWGWDGPVALQAERSNY
jgi:hypothetical protein